MKNNKKEILMIGISNSSFDKIDRNTIINEILHHSGDNPLGINNIIISAKDHLSRLSNRLTIYSDYNNHWDPTFAGIIELIIIMNNQKWDHNLAIEITRHISELSLDYSKLDQIEQ